MTYEDELPEDISDAEYELWFSLSTVDGVRIGPSIEEIRHIIAAAQPGVQPTGADAPELKSDSVDRTSG